jgi:hypothetical protein
MSEFKFACPVCGQHITVPSSSSGTQMECPTCFRKIVVPQAPAGNDSKLLLEAAQPTQPRPTSSVSDLSALRRPRSRASLVTNIALALVLLVAAGVLFSYRTAVLKLLGLGPRPVAQVTDIPTNATPVEASWTLDPAKAVIPEHEVSGRLHGADFTCEKALFGGGTLSLRKGQGWPPDLGLDILLSAQKAEQLNGKNIIIAPGARSVVSKVVLRWKDASNRPQQNEIKSGYALTLLFGQPAAQRLPGRLYISLPDSEKSYLAGTFEAEISQPRASGK